MSGRAARADSIFKHDLTVEWVSIEDLRPDPRNPNNGDVEAVKVSILEHGLYRAIVANKRTMQIIAGHTTVQALAELGAEKVAVQWVDVDDDEALRMLLADNEASRKAKMDEGLLVHAIDSLPDLRGTLFSDRDVEDLRSRLAKAQETPLNFPEVDENLATNQKCPKCGYEWSGPNK